MGDLFHTGKPIVIASFETWNATAGRFINGIVYALEPTDAGLRIRWKSPTEDVLALDRAHNNLAVGDLDGDGRVELLLARGDRVRRLVWNGGGFRDLPELQLAPKDGVARVLTGVAAADMDGDGRAELAVAALDRTARPHTILFGYDWDGGGWRPRWEARPLLGEVRGLTRFTGGRGRADELWFYRAADPNALQRLAFARGREPFSDPLPAGVTVRELAAPTASDPMVIVLGWRQGEPGLFALQWRQRALASVRPLPVAAPGRIGRIVSGDIDGDGRAELLAVRDSELLVMPF